MTVRKKTSVLFEDVGGVLSCREEDRFLIDVLETVFYFWVNRMLVEKVHYAVFLDSEHLHTEQDH